MKNPSEAFVGSFDLWFYLSLQFSEECLNRLAKALDPHISPLSLSIQVFLRDRDLEDEPFMQLTNNLTNVHTLCVDSTPNRILKYLARPNVIGGVLQYPFPRLWDLTIVDFDSRDPTDPSAILEMLVTRNSAFSEERETSGGAVPVCADKLQSLCVRRRYHPIDEVVVSGIRDLVQDVRWKCDGDGDG